MKRYKLFITDYDGTLGYRSVIEPDTLAAVNEFIAQGGKFVVCTGRMFDSIKNILLGYDLKCLVVSYQGAMIDDLSSGRRIFSGGMDYKLAAEVTAMLKKEDADVAVDIGETRVYERRSEFIDTYEKVTGVHGRQVTDMVKEITENKLPVAKITILANPQKIKELTVKYSALLKDKLIVNNGDKALAEFVSPECDKGAAVRRVAEYYGISLDEVITAGDSTNDVKLVGGEWFGVATGDAAEELKKVADEITVPYKDKPVKYLLEKYCLD